VRPQGCATPAPVTAVDGMHAMGQSCAVSGKTEMEGTWVVSLRRKGTAQQWLPGPAKWPRHVLGLVSLVLRMRHRARGGGVRCGAQAQQ
jgi:hypothetical protein